MIRFLIEKEFKQIFRNSFLPKLIIGFPIMAILIMPWAANQEIKNINVEVVDLNHSSFSRRLVQKIEGSTYFHLVGTSPSYEQALDPIESGKADLILTIGQDFEKQMITQGTSSVMIAANSVDGMKGGIGSSYMLAILTDFSSDLRRENPSLSGDRPEVRFSISPQFLFNPRIDYKLFMIPALMVMVITMLAGFLPALNIVGEKEKGTIEQINVTPVGKIQFIFAKLIPYWTIGFLVLTLCIALAEWTFGFVPAGDYLTIYVFAMIYVFVVSGIGLIISNYSDTMQQALFVVFFVVMVLNMMSGLFTPVSSMPDWAQTITLTNPLKFFMNAMRQIYLKGSGLSDLIPELSYLTGMAVFFFSWAVISYRKKN